MFLIPICFLCYLLFILTLNPKHKKARYNYNLRGGTFYNCNIGETHYHLPELQHPDTSIIEILERCGDRRTEP
jgi:hypothetical protein